MSAFVQVDVFASEAYAGNPLAVFTDATGLSSTQMQAVAKEMNLSETTFVTSYNDDSYDVRIFTPTEELPFEGHPSLGTAWVLHHLGLVKATAVTQNSRAGATPLRFENERVWLRRSGHVEPDLETADPKVAERLAAALALEVSDIGLEARELGRSGRLRPALADAGLRQLMLPLRDIAALERSAPNARALLDEGRPDVYCFTAAQAGRVRARSYMTGLGVQEDPATGSAGAGLGLYLADRVGAIDFEITQGVEVGRESSLLVRATPGSVEVGGACHRVLTGTLEQLPRP